MKEKIERGDVVSFFIRGRFKKGTVERSDFDFITLREFENSGYLNTYSRALMHNLTLISKGDFK